MVLGKETGQGGFPWQHPIRFNWLDFLRLEGFHDGEFAYRFSYRDGERTPYAMEREDGAEVTLYYDQVGSLRVVADAGGNVIKEVLYDPFGGIIEDSNPGLRVPIGFAGGLHDRDLGFVRFGWRDYDTFTSRWTAPDPLGDTGGDPDWYGYCLDDPVNGNDPTGLILFGGAGIATAVMGATGLIQHAPALNQWGIAMANDVMDGSYGYISLMKDAGSAAWEGAKKYPDIVDKNIDKSRKNQKSRADYYRERQRERAKERNKAPKTENPDVSGGLNELENAYEQAKKRRQGRGW